MTGPWSWPITIAIFFPPYWTVPQLIRSNAVSLSLSKVTSLENIGEMRPRRLFDTTWRFDAFWEVFDIWKLGNQVHLWKRYLPRPDIDQPGFYAHYLQEVMLIDSKKTETFSKIKQLRNRRSILITQNIDCFWMYIKHFNEVIGVME